VPGPLTECFTTSCRPRIVSHRTSGIRNHLNLSTLSPQWRQSKERPRYRRSMLSSGARLVWSSDLHAASIDFVAVFSCHDKGQREGTVGIPLLGGNQMITNRFRAESRATKLRRCCACRPSCATASGSSCWEGRLCSGYAPTTRTTSTELREWSRVRQIELLDWTCSEPVDRSTQRLPCCPISSTPFRSTATWMSTPIWRHWQGFSVGKLRTSSCTSPHKPDCYGQHTGLPRM
jgi:hypothetical protein